MPANTNHGACVDCGADIIQTEKNGGTGYAETPRGRLCYQCCADEDRKFMREHGRNTLYLTSETTRSIGDALRDGPGDTTWFVGNWPDTLKIRCGPPRVGRHNFAGVRYDVWFLFEGQRWHGVQYGDNTQIVHCKRTKEKANG